jgi:hypothetical protein
MVASTTKSVARPARWKVVAGATCGVFAGAVALFAGLTTGATSVQGEVMLILGAAVIALSLVAVLQWRRMSGAMPIAASRSTQ